MDEIDHIYQKNLENRPGTVFFYLKYLKQSLDIATTISENLNYILDNAGEDSGISDDSDSPLKNMPKIVRPIYDFPDIIGVSQASTSKSLAYSGNRKKTKKRKRLSNNSVQKPVSKKRKKTTLDKQIDEEFNNQILRNSLRRPKRKRTLQSREEESSAEESENEDTVYAEPSVRYFRRQRSDSPEDSTADESQAEEGIFPPTVRSDSPEDSTADESQAEERIFPPTVARSARRKRRDNIEELTADESQDEDMLSELRKRPSLRRQKRHFQVESDSQNEILNDVSRNSGISRRGRRRAVYTDDTSQDETLTELEDQQTEEYSYIPNPRNLYGKFKRKQSLQNKRDKIDSQEEQSADDSQSELLRSSFSFKSIRMLRRGSQEDSTANESQNDELGIENLTSVKRRKGRTKKSVNRNKGLKSGRSKGKAISTNDAFQNETLISECKRSLNELVVKCYDILNDPSFESDPVVRKFKKDKLLFCDSPREDKSSGKDKTHDEIVDEEPESSKNQDREDKDPDTEGIKDSFKQAPSALCESDSASFKNRALRYIRTSRRGRRGKRKILSVNDSSKQNSLNNLNVPEKEDVHPTAHELLSDIDSEKKIYSTDVEQGDKPGKELNEDEDNVHKTKSNIDEAKEIEADSEFKMD